MKKYAIPIVVVLAVLAVTWSAFAQAQDRASQRERYQNMSPEEQAKFREQRGGGSRRARVSREDQQKAIKAIEEALVKVKAAAQIQMPQGGFQDLSEEERNKLRTAYRDRSTALQAIIAQVAADSGGRGKREGQRDGRASRKASCQRQRLWERTTGRAEASRRPTRRSIRSGRRQDSGFKRQSAASCPVRRITGD
ncbi:MAG: hypothetical protein ACYTGS_21015 [Planctomycetota bacterium]|jgi:hypothetical protein